MLNVRVSRPPLPPKEAFKNLIEVLRARRTYKRLYQKLRHDRLLMRGSALAYETLLSIVPLTAVAMASVRLFADQDSQEAVLQFLADQYVPASADRGVQRFLALVRHLDFSTIGLVGLAALLPVMFSLVDAVELCLSDIFRTPRRAHWFRFLTLGAILTIAPLGSLLTVRYVPLSGLAFDHVVTPMVFISVILHVVFRNLPSVKVSHRASATGAIIGGVLLSTTKAAFGLYATHLARSIHLVWGAVAFVPLLLIWVLLAWIVVLLGAEVATVLDQQLKELETAPPLRRSIPPPSQRKRRLRLRVVRKQRPKPRRGTTPRAV